MGSSGLVDITLCKRVILLAEASGVSGFSAPPSCLPKTNSPASIPALPKPALLVWNSAVVVFSIAFPMNLPKGVAIASKHAKTRTITTIQP